MTLSLEEIKSAERAMDEVRASLAAMGREIYQMRNGDEIGCQYGFHGYFLQTYEGSHYVGQDGPNWGIGTPIVSLTYYWSRACKEEIVTFPQSYLGEDWRTLEQTRIDQERQALADAQAQITEDAARQKEISERCAYKRLHAKYGGTDGMK